MGENLRVQRARLLSSSQRVVDTLIALGENDIAENVEELTRKYAHSELMISVMGVTKRGKSTLINAILGRTDDAAAPIDVLPATSVISQYSYSPEENVVVRYLDGEEEHIGLNEIREFVTEEQNPDNRKGVDRVYVEGPFPNMRDLSMGKDIDLIINDTPGAQSIEENYDDILYNLIPFSDIILYVFTLDQQLTPKDMEFLRDLNDQKSSEHGLILVLNKTDQLDEQETDNAVRYAKDILRQYGIRPGRIVRVSAKESMSRPGLEGMEELFRTVEQAVDSSQNHKMRLYSVAERVLFITRPVLVSMNMQESKIRELRRAMDELSEEDSARKERFRDKWRRTLDVYEKEMSNAEDELIARVENEFTKEAISVSYLRKFIQHELNQMVQMQISEPINNMNKGLLDAIGALNASMLDIENEVDATCMPEEIRSTYGKLIAPGTKTAAGIVLAAGSPAIPAIITSAVAGSGSGVIGTAMAWVGGVAVAPLATLLGFAAFPLGLIIAGSGVVKFRRALKNKKHTDKVNVVEISKDAIRKKFKIFNQQIASLRDKDKDVLQEYDRQKETRIREIKKRISGEGQSIQQQIELKNTIESELEEVRRIREEIATRNAR